MTPSRRVPTRVEGQWKSGQSTADDRKLVRPIRIRPDIPAAEWKAIASVIDSGSPETWAAQWGAYATERKRSAPDTAAVALLLRDWILQGWGVSRADSTLWVVPPRTSGADGESPVTVKRRLRSWLEVAREEQLANGSVRAFLRKMETARRHGLNKVSVLSLIDDGADLSAQLAEIARLPQPERGAALARVVRPKLEIVSADNVDNATGLRLMDVWRYFRHTWSIKYRPTPGRTLLFLIRNEARPNGPIMGIGALANATLQITTRDDYIGWSASALTERVVREPGFWVQLRDAMLKSLQEERETIRTDDLLRQVGRVRGFELEKRLLKIAEEAEARRLRDIGKRARAIAQNDGERQLSLKRLPTDANGEIDWRAASRRPLFVAKRAKLLSKILFAERVLKSNLSVPSIDELRSNSDIAQALVIGAREIRKVGLASRVLDLNVCGAVPPYNDLLVGKLAALAASAAEIRSAYAERYSTQPSEIASQMAGRAVVRSVDVCLVTTTSLYGISSSQYNRLQLSVPTQRGPAHVHWVEVGTTVGQGTAQFSGDTIAMLRAASIKRSGGRRVNNVFGEGQSPLLRQVREAFSALGMAEDLLSHGSPRRVYCLDLFPSARDALVLNQHHNVNLPAFESIASAWIDRWLVSRIAYQPALARVATIRANDVALGLRDRRRKQLEINMELNHMSTVTSDDLQLHDVSKAELVRSLYRSLAACADHHDEKTVELLHIETAVDSFLRLRAAKGGVIFVTGNPGDGKTHLLRHLKEVFSEAGMQTILDANQMSDENLAAIVENAYERRRGGVVLAINEGVLVNLLDAYKEKAWAKGVKRYLLAPMWYREAPGVLDSRVCVVDLNLRNNLAPNALRKAIRLLRSLAGPCEGCPKTSCGLYANTTRLHAESSEQLVRLLESIGRTGIHATMRDVHGFLAYVLAGPLSCEETKEATSEPGYYWRNVFEGGQGHLFDAVRKLDPIRNTDPTVDDVLWRSADQPSNWIEPPVSDPRASNGFIERVEAFSDRKRQALFEYLAAAHLATTVTDSVDRLLTEVLEGGNSAVRRLVFLLNRFFDRDETASDVLYLWVAHRFDANQPRFAAASDGMAASSLEVLRPRIRPELETAFPDFQPSHVVLAHRDTPPAEGLRVDRVLLTALLDSANGLPTSFRRGEPEIRIAAFYERLRYRLGESDDATIYVRLVDRDTGSNHRVAVDVRNNTFVQS